FAPIGEDQGTNIVGGGLANPRPGGGTLSDIRRIVPNGDELLCFTKDKLYSWSEAESAWVEKATYLAPKLTERSVFVNTAEQTRCDRAELSGVVLFVWQEQEGSTTNLRAAARDQETGAVLLAPTDIATGWNNPRVLAMGDHFLVFANDPSNTTLWVGRVDLDNLSGVTAIDQAEVTTHFATEYDVVRLTPTTAAVAAVEGSNASNDTYAVALVTSSGGMPSVSAVSKERNAGGGAIRSEEHTSELQSRENLVCRLLLEKKKENIRKE